MNRLFDRIADVCTLISGLSLIAMTSAITYQVVARYIFNASPAWSERLSLLLLGYLVFFGAAAGVQRANHIRISVLEDRLRGPGKAAVQMGAHLGVILAGILMAWAGLEITMRLWSYPIPALGWPRGLALLPLPFSGLLIILFGAGRMLTDFAEARTTWNS